MTGKTKTYDVLQHTPYKSRLWRFNLLRMPMDAIDRSWIAWFATVIFVIIDTVCIYTSMNTVQSENFIMVALISVGLSVCIDVPLAYAATYLKGYFQKVRDRRSTFIILTLAIVCFLIVFVFMLRFRMQTDYLTFSVAENSTLTDTLGGVEKTTSEQDLKTIAMAALLTGILPFCTSLASFLVSLYTANPLGTRISHYDKALLSLDSQISDLQQVLNEAARLPEHRANLEAREKDLYTVFNNDCDSQGKTRKMAVRLAYMRRTNDPNEINRLIDDAEKVAEHLPAPAYEGQYLYSFPKMKGERI